MTSPHTSNSDVNNKIKQKPRTIKLSHSVIMTVLAFVAASPFGYYGFKVVPYDTENPESKETVVFDERYQQIKTVKDGDTVETSTGEDIRLIGIQAPELDECYGTEAKLALESLLTNRQVYVTKDQAGVDRNNRLLRYMFVSRNERPEIGDIHVNYEMIRMGFARVSPIAPNRQYQSDFTRAQTNAQQNNRGIWRYCANEQAQALRQEASKAPSENCQIKGNYAEKEKEFYYFMPGCRNYGRVKVDRSRGEQWFCSEQDALDAGFERSANCPPGIVYE